MLSGRLLAPLAVTVLIIMRCLELADGGITKPQQHMIVKSKTFLSPPLSLKPGLVVEKFYYNIEFPRGHIGIKSFDVEVIDEAAGHQVPVSETYLHHWALLRYYQHKNAADPTVNTQYAELHEPDYIIASNDGVCQPGILPPYYAMGSESKTISTYLPDPYAIQVGNNNPTTTTTTTADDYDFYEERWSLNVHAIDIRGVDDKLGCIECRCHLYNITKDRYGRPLRPDYIGGLECCYDRTQCRVSQSYEGKDQETRNLYLRYTVKWVDWDDDSVIPVNVYLLDVTDTWKPLPHSTDQPNSHQHHHCHIEYDVEPCSSLLTNKVDDDGKCNAMKMSKVMFPQSGYLIYGVAHQHVGGIGSTLHGEDGRVLCSSSPIYGRGNEDGYVIGMTTCYPEPGSIKINNGEVVSLISNYDSTQNHTGVMGIFQIIVAPKIFKPSLHKVDRKTILM